MMIVTLKKSEVLHIGDSSITYLRERGSKGSELGVTAPPSKSIHREEIFVVLKKEKERIKKYSLREKNK